MIETAEEAQVAAVEARAQEWAARSFDHFHPLFHRNPKRSIFAIKAAAELALVCGIAATRETRAAGTSYAALAERLYREVFLDEGVQEYLLSNIAAVPTIGLYGSLRQCGYDDLRFRGRLQRLTESGYPAAVERTPASELDLIHSSRLAGFPCPLDAGEVYARTLLRRRPPLQLLANDDVYGITHTVFFLTDFGREMPAVLRPDLDYLAEAVPRLLDFYLWKQNWDLAAELLLILKCAGLQAADSFAEGWALLLAAQNDDGSYDGPVDEEPQRADEDTTWAQFRDRYHTTLAVLLAIASAF